jgi:hypothetical protein
MISRKRGDNVKITYSIQYDKKLLTRILAGYYLYAFKPILVVIPLAVAILWFCYPNSFDLQMQILFFVCGMLVGWVHMLSRSFFGGLMNGFWEIGKCGDNKTDFTLSGESMVRVSKLVKAEYSWDLLFRIVEMKSYLLLILRNRGFVPVPKEVPTAEGNAWLDSKLRSRKGKKGQPQQSNNRGPYPSNV